MKEAISSTNSNNSIKFLVLLFAVFCFTNKVSSQEAKSKEPVFWDSNCWSNNSDEAQIHWVNDIFITKCQFNSPIIPPNYIASIEIGNEVDKSSLFYHHYYLETEICDTKKCKDCNERYVYNLMISNKSLCVPTTEITQMHNCEATFLDEAAAGIYQTDPILTTLFPDSYSLMNYTVKIKFKKEVLNYDKDGITVRIGSRVFRGESYEHILHPGRTQRTIFKRGSKIYIGTLGDGTVKLGTLNNCLGKQLFTKIDEALVTAFKCKETPGSISPNAKFIQAAKLFSFNDGLALIQSGTSEAIINSSGNFSIPYGKYHYDIDGYKFGLCGVYETYSTSRYNRGNKGFVNSEGELVVPYRYKSATFFSPALGSAQLSTDPPGDGYLIDNTGKYILNSSQQKIPLRWTETDEGKIVLRALEKGHGENRRFLFADHTLTTKIPTQFISAHDFHEGLAAVRKEPAYNVGKWGFINDQGQTIIPFIYDREPADFHSGRALVILNESTLKNGSKVINYGYIDKTGKIIDKTIQQVGADCFEQAYYHWEWSEYRNGYVFCGEQGVCSSSTMLMDLQGDKFDLKNATIDFDYHKQPIKVKFPRNGNGDFFYITIYQNSWLPSVAPTWNAGGIMLVWENKAKQVISRKGIISPKGEVILPPIFEELGIFDSVSQLAYAKYINEAGLMVEGYIDINGVFQIVKQ